MEIANLMKEKSIAQKNINETKTKITIIKNELDDAQRKI